MENSYQKITTFLMFGGRAEEAMKEYISVFDGSGIISITKYGEENEGEIPGSVMHAVFTLSGQNFMCMDSNYPHQFTFTPSMSLYVACKSEEEIDRAFHQLSQGGAVLMELGPYPFSEKFGWVQDKFGVSWQLNLVKQID